MRPLYYIALTVAALAVCAAIAVPFAIHRYSVTNFLHAARDNDVAYLKSAIDAGIDANVKNYTGWTALAVASREGNVMAVVTLLMAHANPNSAVGCKGLLCRSPLDEAAKSDHAEVANLLLQAGAKDLYKALIDTAFYDHADVVQLLLDAHANPNALDAEDGVQTPLIGAALQRATDIVALLLKAGADPNLSNTTGHPPLWYARDPEIVDMLRAASGHT
jgi:hypothetical protein